MTDIETIKTNIQRMSQQGIPSAALTRAVFDHWVEKEPRIKKYEEYKYDGNSFIYPFGKKHIKIRAIPVRVK